MNLYLIKRGPRPSYHKAMFHPVIICSRKHVAEWEVGATDARSWMWVRETSADDGAGFLIVRWNGLDIDYGHIVREVGPMPDGTLTAFFHPHESKKEPWSLIKGAIWWDDREMPKMLKLRGCIYPPDDFSKSSILDKIADDGSTGGGNWRPQPTWWESK